MINWMANELGKSSVETTGDQTRRLQRFSTRDLVYIAVLSALWAASENLLGGQLHAMNIPLSGAVLAAIGVFLMVTCRSLVPKMGSILLMGVVVALLKVLSIGGVVLSPMIAIFVETVLVELAMTVGGTTLLASSIGGMLADAYSIVHPFIFQPLLFGASMVVIYQKTISAASKIFGIDPANVILIILALAISQGVLGVIGGVAGWKFSARAKRALRR
jgi:hypothetical protein